MPHTDDRPEERTMPYTDQPSEFASPRLFPYNDEGEPMMTDAQYRYANSLDDERDFEEEGYWRDYRDDEPDETVCHRCDYAKCQCAAIWPAEDPLSAEMETERELALAGMPMTD
jgi:hypothetical protein